MIWEKLTSLLVSMCGCCKVCIVGCAVWVTDARELKFVCCCGLETATGVLLTGGCCFFLSESFISWRNKWHCNLVWMRNKWNDKIRSHKLVWAVDLNSIQAKMFVRLRPFHNLCEYFFMWRMMLKMSNHLLCSIQNINRLGQDYHKNRNQNGTLVALDLIRAPFCLGFGFFVYFVLRW